MNLKIARSARLLISAWVDDNSSCDRSKRSKPYRMGYFLTGREEHAAQAKKLLRAWFLDPAPTGAEERYRGGDF